MALCLLLRLFVFRFFFQAEDGIRDLTVTGVQTCALPIYLRLGHHHVRMVAGEGGHVRPHTLLECGGAQVRLPLPDSDSSVGLARVDGEVPAALRQPDQRADVTLPEPARAHHALAAFREILDPEGKLAPAEHPRRMEQPLEVFLQAEDRGPARRAIAADPLERGHSVVQRGREEVQPRLRRRAELPVQPHLRWRRAPSRHYLCPLLWKAVSAFADAWNRNCMAAKPPFGGRGYAWA